MFRLPSLRITSVAVICVLILVVLAIPNAPATVHVAREDGPQKAAEGQPVGQVEFHPVTLTDKNKPKPRVLTHPNEMALVAAKSKVFNVKTLKSKVVKLERPEHEAPGIEDPDAMSGEDSDAEHEPDGDQDADRAVDPASDPDGPPDPDRQMPLIVDPDSLTGNGAQNAPAPAPSTTFDGLDFANWGQGHPPDTNGDVGPNYYIQAINVSIGIYEKSSGVRVAAFTFNSFMSQGAFGNLCDTDNFGDPVVLYDSFEDRWVITDFAFKIDGSGNVNPQHVFQCFAVSKTGDPVSGGWNYYSIETPGGLGDYPKFGIWPDGLYMSANMFGYSSAASYSGFHVWALNKLQMYAGAPSVQVIDFAGDTSDFTVLPANSRLQTGTPPAGSPEYFVSTETFLNALSIYKFHADWDKVSTSTFSGPFTQSVPNCWPNSNVANASTPANSADTLPIRAMAQAQYSNIAGAESVWVDHTVNRGVFTIAACGGTNTNNATVRWYQANVTGGTVAANVVQGASYDPEGANTFFRFMPSLAVDRVGDMAIGYTKSNSTTNPQIKYAGRLAGDAVNTFSQTEQTLIDGTGSQGGNCGGSACVRWGDYSGMALDPNGCEFWETGEYYATTGLNHLTRIGSFHFPGCTPVGNGTLSGTVTDGVNLLAGATVTLGSRTTTTNASGVYSFTVPAGTYPTETATKPGFDPASAVMLVVPNGGALTKNFALSAAAQSGCFTDNTQSTFQRGVPNNCNLVVSPGNVVLANPDNTGSKNGNVSPSGFAITNTSWAGQTFTPTVTGQLKRVDVELFCLCTVTSPNVTLSIRATTGTTPVPTGADLAIASIPGFNDGGVGGLKTFTFASPVTFTAGTRYAFIFRLSAPPAGGNTVAYTCSCATTGFPDLNPYANGQRVFSSTSGSSWTADTTVGGRDLNFITYINPGFAPTGTFVSSLKDANPAAGNSATWTTLTFTDATPAGTSVKFRVAASNSATGPFSFVGPDGTAATFFTTSGASLSQFNGFRYLKYEAILATSDGLVTPTLSNVQICFADATGVASTALDVDPASGAYGGSATLTATLTSSGSGVSGKTVSFTLNGSSAGSATTDGSGVATLSNVSLAGINAGSYPSGVSASFDGDASFAASSGSDVLTVDPADQAINVTTHAPASAAFGSSFTVAATGGGSGNAVTFSSSGACSNVGATFTMTSGTGSCSVKYDQAGNTDYKAAPQVIDTTTAGKVSTSTALSSSANPAVFSRSVVFTATVSSGAGTPTGTVQFKIDGVNLGAPVPLDGTGKAASAATTTLAVGSRAISAVYSGGANFTASTGTLSESVTKANVTVSVTSNHNPVKKGTSITFTVTVAPVSPATKVPGGNVKLFRNGTQIGSKKSLSGGKVSWTITWTAGTGTFKMTAKYLGTINFNAKSSAIYSQVVTT